MTTSRELGAPVPVARTETLKFQGYEFAYRVFPNARARLDPILIVGGAFQDKDSWTPHQQLLGPHATVVTVDLPGWGTADRLPPGHGCTFLAAALHHLVDAIGHPRINLVGVSYGAAVAYCLAQRAPDRVAHLALNGISRQLPAERRRDTADMVEMLRARRYADFTESILAAIQPSPQAWAPERADLLVNLIRAQFQYLREDTADRYADACARIVGNSRLRPGISGVPTLVFTGEHDVCTPPALGQEVADMIDGARFHTVPNASHMFGAEAPQRFCDLLLDHFQDDSKAPHG